MKIAWKSEQLEKQKYRFRALKSVRPKGKFHYSMNLFEQKKWEEKA